MCLAIDRKYRTSRFLGFCMKFFSFIPLVNKVYGGISYDRECSEIQGIDYVKVSFEEGMRRSISI